MGFTPQQVGRMSLFQFACCVEGVKAANNPNPAPAAPTADEFRAAKLAHGDL